MSATRLAVLDYGMGNLRSCEKAFERVGAEARVTSDLEWIAAADGVVLPGVGAFPRAMGRIGELGLDGAIARAVEAGTPTLGICLGMQLLFDGSSELGGADGLGLLDGVVEALDAPGLKVPHIGWNPVRWRQRSVLNEGLPQPCPFYHVHSFSPLPAVRMDIVGTASYGTELVSAVGRGEVYGVQFHPEKSGAHGLRLLANFTALCGAGASRRAA